MVKTTPLSENPSDLIRRLGKYALVGGDKVVRIPVNVVLAGLTSRALGVEDYGLFCTVIVLIATISPLASFGLESAGIALATRSGAAATYIKQISGLRLISGLAAAALFVLVATIFLGTQGSQLAGSALVVISLVFLLRVYEIGEHILFSQDRLVTLAAIRVLAFVSASFTILLVLWLGPSLRLLLILNGLEALLLLVGYGIALRSDIRRSLRTYTERHSIRTMLEQFRATLPIFISGVLVLLLLNIDKLLVFHFLGKTQVGLYGAAARLIEVLYFIPLVVGTVHAASFARLANSDGFSSHYRAAFVAATWLSVAAAAALAILSNIIVPLIFGSAFSAASRALALLAPTVVAVTWVSLRTRALAAMNEFGEILRLTVIAFVIHVPLLLIGLWFGSIEAVAICQTLGWLVGATLVPLASKKSKSFSPVRMLWKGT